MSSSIKSKFVFSMMNTVSQIAFPLVTFPYAARVLGPSNLGIYNFSNSIVVYLVMLSGLGLNIYGQRLVASVRDSRSALSRVMSELIFLNLILSTFLFSCYLLSVYMIPRFSHQRIVFVITGMYLLMSPLALEWFFRGVEDFKYVAIRTFIVRLILLGAMFYFVRTENDLVPYTIISLLTICIPFILNAFRVRKFCAIQISCCMIRPMFNHMAKLSSSGVYMLLTSIYTSFPILYLGFVADDSSVGQFAISQRLTAIVISVFAALSAVLFPRVSAMIAKGENSSIDELLKKSFEVVVPIAILFSASLLILAPSIVNLIAGVKYEESGKVLMILAPLIFLTPLSQVFLNQVLLPFHKERKVLGNTIYVSVFGLATVVTFTMWDPIFGTAFSVLFSELLMTILLWKMSVGNIAVEGFNAFIIKNFAIGAVYCVTLFIINNSVSHLGLKLAISIVILLLEFSILQLYVSKNSTLSSLLFSILTGPAKMKEN